MKFLPKLFSKKPIPRTARVVHVKQPRPSIKSELHKKLQREVYGEVRHS